LPKLNKIVSICLNQLWIIFLIAILGIWKSIPLGFILNIDPLWTGIMTVLGALGGIVVLFFLGGTTKRFVLKRLERKGFRRKEQKMNRLMERYGIIGLGIFGTLVMGPNATMAIGLVIVRSNAKLLLWTSVGVLLWTAVLTLIGTLGLGLFHQ
jgi:membrane protein DedA with SNARE-associated domain